MCLAYRPLLRRLLSALLPPFGLGFSTTLAAQTSDWATDPYAVYLAHGAQGQVASFDAGEFDDVALITGALSLAIPFGQVYPAGGRLSYQRAAHYGSKETEARLRTKCTPPSCEHFSADLPYALSQAGRGHLCRLLEPDDWGDWASRPFGARDQGHTFHEE